MKKLVLDSQKKRLQKDIKKHPENYLAVPAAMQDKIARGDVILTEKESQKEIKKLRKQVEKFAGYKPPKKDREL